MLQFQSPCAEGQTARMLPAVVAVLEVSQMITPSHYGVLVAILAQGRRWAGVYLVTMSETCRG